MYGETDGVISIFLLCANIWILTVTKFTEMNRVVGRSVCTLLRDAALGRNLPDKLNVGYMQHCPKKDNRHIIYICHITYIISMQTKT